MEIDVMRQIGAITREVTSREHEGKLARVVRASRTYATSVADVWDALTNAERIPRWFLPISGNLEIGGRYQLQGNAGGTIEQCEPPNRLAVTWEMGGAPSWLVVTLSAESEERTRLELEHVAHVPEEMWVQFGPGAVGVGWDLSLVGLDRHLTTGRSKDPKAAAAWPVSEEGKRFIRGSSDGWCRASIAAGTDTAAAQAAAAGTVAFYTGAAP